MEYKWNWGEWGQAEPMAEPNEKGHHPGPSRSEPSKDKIYKDLTEVERKATAGKKITECSSLKANWQVPFQLGPPIRDIPDYLDLYGQPGPGPSGLPGGIIQV